MIDEDAGGHDGADEIDKQHIKTMLSQERHLGSCLHPIEWLNAKHFVAIL